MGSRRTTIVALGLWALAVWSVGGVVLTREVLVASRAADVVAASPLCPPVCPGGAAPSWLALAVMAAWVLIAVGSTVALVILLSRRALGPDDT